MTFGIAAHWLVRRQVFKYFNAGFRTLSILSNYYKAPSRGVINQLGGQDGFQTANIGGLAEDGIQGLGAGLAVRGKPSDDPVLKNNLAG